MVNCCQKYVHEYLKVGVNWNVLLLFLIYNEHVNSLK